MWIGFCQPYLLRHRYPDPELVTEDLRPRGAPQIESPASVVMAGREKVQDSEEEGGMGLELGSRHQLFSQHSNHT